MVTGATMGELRGPPLQENTGERGGEDIPLVGPRNESEVEVNGMKCRTLIDSGFQVTTVTHTYWHNHPALQDQKLQPSKIPIEGAAAPITGSCTLT